MRDPRAAPTRRTAPGLHAWRVLAFLAWRNLWRNRLRSLLTLGAMVVGLTLMVGYLAMVEGLFRQMVGFATNLSIGHLQVHRAAFIADQDLYALLPAELLARLRSETPHRYAPRSYAAGLASAGNEASGALLQGVNPAAERRVTDLHRRLRAGAFALTATAQAYPHGPDGPGVPVYPVVIGHKLARNLQLDVGGELVLITQAADGSIGNGLFAVRGILQPIEPAFDRMGVVMSLAALDSLMFLGDGVHEVAVRTADVAALPAAKAEIEAAVAGWPGADALADDPGGPVRVRTWAEINPTLHDMIANSQVAVYIVAVIVFTIAAMGILNTMLMATYERRHELAILLALGMGRGAMMLMVMLEAFFLACFGGAVGSATGAALAWYLQVVGWDYSHWLPEGLDFLGVVIDPVYKAYLLPQHVWISALMMLGTTLVAAFLPSWRTARLSPARALHP